CRIVFTGQAEVSWVEARQKDASQPETVVGRQTLFQCCSQLFGKGPDEKASQPGHLIRAGFHQFRFHFQLPERLPSSFEHFSDTGRVKARVAYCLRVDLENSWRTAGHSRERRILVLRSRDLNRCKSLTVSCPRVSQAGLCMLEKYRLSS
uniref:Arrestin_N domain-containing protein n=1 Tax=Macrostomum lignano TaxID=282301 RepID=A0A1I8J8B7_9PLAT